MAENESIPTRAARRALEFESRMEAVIADRMRHGIGYTGISTYATRRIIRQAIAGDTSAMGKLDTLAQVNQHQPGDDCAICQQVQAVLKGG